LLSKILPVQIRAQPRYHTWASFIHGGLFLLKQVTKATHLLIEKSNILKNELTKKGVEYF
jgi:hypothetical protein